jgi:S1-C subfamily serine protease
MFITNMKFSTGLAASLFSTAVAIALVQPAIMAQSASQVANTARQITVLIQGQNPGSGVIIRREGNTYTVLTARHVVAAQDEYDIVTPDGKKYRLNYNTVKFLPGVDLAILQFTSSESYTVARIGDSTKAVAGTPVYVSGFPLTSRAIDQVVYNFTQGLVTANASRPLQNGYTLVYTNPTLPGMSGGPVLNANGEVIGIHGSADTTARPQAPQINPNVYVKTGFNLAIPINTFLTLVPKVAANLGLRLPFPVTVPGQMMADDYFLRGQDNMNNRNFQAALPDFEQAIRLRPTFADAYFTRGQMRTLFLMDFQGAMPDFDQAIRLRPDYGDAYCLRAAARTGEHTMAAQKRQTDLMLNSSNPGRAILNNARENLNELRRVMLLALPDQEQCVRLKPDDAIAWATLASLRSHTGDCDGARAASIKRIELMKAKGEDASQSEASLALDQRLRTCEMQRRL